MTEIGILIYPGAQMASVLGMTDLFTLADSISARGGAGAPRLVVTHWRAAEAEETPARIDGGHPRSGGAPSVCILPPSLEGPPTTIGHGTTRWLLERHKRGATLASVCTGAFILGSTGLLSGRAVTTHWTYEDRFRERFPEALVNTDRLVIDEGDVVTAGGIMAWTDLALTLVERHLGAAVMLEVARTFLIDPPGREQSFYSGFSPKLDHQDVAILKVQTWLQETRAKIVDVPSLAAVAGLEERTFLRRFQKATGYTSTEYWQRLRVARARLLLQEGRLSSDQIAWDVGYADPGAFRKVFSRVVGLTPAEYRNRFKSRGRPDALAMDGARYGMKAGG